MPALLGLSLKLRRDRVVGPEEDLCLARQLFQGVHYWLFRKGRHLMQSGISASAALMVIYLFPFIEFR